MSAVSNAKWVAVSQAARIVSQLANIFVLARILPPSDYGLMAMATVVTNLALLIRDQGTSAAIIQKENLGHHTINTVFWFNIAVGFTIAALIMAGAPLIAGYFKHGELINILLLLALVFPISSSSISHQALLERESKFKKLAFIELVASTIAMVIAVIAALYGAGVYSLVLQAILLALLSSIQIWLASEWRPKGKPSLRELKDLLPFTGHMTTFQLITYFFRNADSMVIGRLLGVVPLGIYSMAYRIMLLPVQNITWAASRALFPVMSRQQNALDEMGKLYLQTLGFIAFLTAPLMAGIFSVRELFVEVAFGQRWLPVAGVLAWLTAVGFMQSISSTTGTVFMAQGKTKLLMWVSLFNAAIHLVAFGLGAEHGVNGVAQWYFYASFISGIVSLKIAGSLVHCSPSQILNACIRPIAIAGVMCMIVRTVYWHSLDMWWNNITALIGLSALGIVIYFAIYYLFLRDTLRSYLTKFFKRNAA
jgi:PST family polysaccharide transporter